MVDTILACYRPSTYRQHKVAWAAFHRWLPRTNTAVSKNAVFCFLQDLFMTKFLVPRTIPNYRSALKWPLEETFGIYFSHPDFSCLAMGLFHLSPPATPVVPQWNLLEVLYFYEGVDQHSCSAQRLLLKTLCLTALASGNRCSELAQLYHRAIVDLGTSLTLPMMHRFLYENQTAIRTPPPISFPNLPNSLVCLVATLRTFPCRSATWDHEDFLLVNPSSHASLVAGRLNYWLVKAIVAADSNGLVIRAHDVRKFAVSVNWTRRVDLRHIIHYGFLASAHPFLNTYLHSINPVLPPCVAAGSVLPSTSNI